MLETVARLYSPLGMPKVPDKIAIPTPEPTPKIVPGIIQLPPDPKVEADAQHMVKVLKRVKQIAPELWGIFRVK